MVISFRDKIWVATFLSQCRPGYFNDENISYSSSLSFLLKHHESVCICVWVCVVCFLPDNRGQIHYFNKEGSSLLNKCLAKRKAKKKQNNGAVPRAGEAVAGRLSGSLSPGPPPAVRGGLSGSAQVAVFAGSANALLLFWAHAAAKFDYGLHFNITTTAKKKKKRQLLLKSMGLFFIFYFY